jgi:hypothetical protein
MQSCNPFLIAQNATQKAHKNACNAMCVCALRRASRQNTLSLNALSTFYHHSFFFASKRVKQSLYGLVLRFVLCSHFTNYAVNSIQFKSVQIHSIQ